MKSRVDVGLLTSLCAVAFLNLISIQAGSFINVQTEDTSDCLLCRQCGYDVSDVIHLYRHLSPSALIHGNQSLFGTHHIEYQVLENPLGIQFKVVTVARARCAATEEWHSEFSWFPGYAWKHCLCNHCGHHLGWIFEPLATAVKGQGGPTSQGFYAIILDNILSEKCDVLTEEQRDFLAFCEALFANRFTDKDEEFVKVLNDVLKPPIIDPWYNKPKRNFNWSNQGDRGHNNWRSRYNERRHNRAGGYSKEGRYQPY